jgi:hypothetical protein
MGKVDMAMLMNSQFERNSMYLVYMMLKDTK